MQPSPLSAKSLIVLHYGSKRLNGQLKQCRLSIKLHIPGEGNERSSIRPSTPGTNKRKLKFVEPKSQTPGYRLHENKCMYSTSTPYLKPSAKRANLEGPCRNPSRRSDACRPKKRPPRLGGLKLQPSSLAAALQLEQNTLGYTVSYPVLLLVYVVLLLVHIIYRNGRAAWGNWTNQPISPDFSDLVP